jgi:pentatricopeptide repeat protein
MLCSIPKKFPKNNGNVVDSYNEIEKMGIALDVVSYNILIKCYSCANLPGYSLCFFAKVLKLGFEPTSFTLKTLLKEFFSRGKVDEAIKFYTSCDSFGISSDQFSNEILVDRLCKQGDIESAVKWVRENVNPDIAMLNTVIDAFCKNPTIVVEAYQLYDDFIDNANSYADVNTYNALIRGSCVTHH